MQSLIIIGSRAKCEDYTQEFLKSKKILPYNVVRFESVLKISYVSILKKKLSIKSSELESRVIVIESEITYEAQNALLKILEEPPLRVFVLIFTQSSDLLISTIVSRCEAIFLEKEKKDTLSNIEAFDIYNKSDTSNFTKTYLLLKSFNFLSSMEDFEKFMVSYRRFIIQQLMQYGPLDKKMISDFIHFFDNYSLLKNNNVNRRLMVESESL